jgi:hypothetical protein
VAKKTRWGFVVVAVFWAWLLVAVVLTLRTVDSQVRDSPPVPTFTATATDEWFPPQPSPIPWREYMPMLMKGQ